MKQQIVFLLDNTFVNDRRVKREAKSLIKVGFTVTILAVKGHDLVESEEVDGIKIKRIFDLDIFDIKKQKCFTRYAKKIIENYAFQVMHAHDQSMLHLASKIKRLKPQTTLIYDSHELFHAWPLNLSNYNNFIILLKSWIVRKIQTRREKLNYKYIDYIVTVNKSLADDLNKYLKAKQYPLVIRNLPEKVSINQKTNILRAKFNISQDRKILVFIGANIYRHTLNIEQVMTEMQQSSEYALVFICAFNQNSKPVMDFVAQKKLKHIYFHNIIPPYQIPEFLASADVGLVPTWNKKDLSYWYALDNKLFEYIQSEIPVLATQQPEYLKIIAEYNCGICVNPDETDAYLLGLNKIIANYEKYKVNIKLAKEQLCWEKEEQKLINFYMQITKYNA